MVRKFTSVTLVTDRPDNILQQNTCDDMARRLWESETTLNYEGKFKMTVHYFLG